MDDGERVVRVEVNEGWAEVVLDRPQRKNALTGPLAVQLKDAVIRLNGDEEIAAIVLRGEGGSFCSGIDLKELQADPPHPWAADLQRDLRAAHLALFACTVPIFGAFERYGINAGAAVALACDVLIAGESAFLQIGEIQQGADIPINAAWLRIRVGEAIAARITLYGDRVPASELYRLGLVAEVVADDEVLPRARALAERLAGFPKGSPAQVKRALRAQGAVEDPEDWFQLASGAALRSADQVRD